MSLGSSSSTSVWDTWIAPGLRLWMLIALVSGVLLIMIVIVCCFMRIRIPRTKRQIDLIAAKRKMRKKKGETQNQHDERSAAIVMNSMPHKPTGLSHGEKSRSGDSEKKSLVQSSSKMHTAV